MEEKGGNMADGFSTNDAVLWGAMNNMGRGGYGGGYGGGAWGSGVGGGCGVPYANLASIQHGLDYNAQKTEDSNDCNRAVFGQAIDSMSGKLEGLQRDNQFTATNKSISDGNARVCDRLNQIEVTDLVKRGDDNLNMFRELAAIRAENKDCCCETQKELLKMQLETQKCCCENKELVYQENQKTRDLISENALRAAVDANNINATINPIVQAMAAQTNALIDALSRRPHHG